MKIVHIASALLLLTGAATARPGVSLGDYQDMDRRGKTFKTSVAPAVDKPGAFWSAPTAGWALTRLRAAGGGGWNADASGGYALIEVPASCRNRPLLVQLEGSASGGVVSLNSANRQGVAVDSLYSFNAAPGASGEVSTRISCRLGSGATHLQLALSPKAAFRLSLLKVTALR